MIGSRIGSYEIVAQLGAGGMGEVYRARDTKLDRDVAIKILPPEFATDAERVSSETQVDRSRGCKAETKARGHVQEEPLPVR